MALVGKTQEYPAASSESRGVFLLLGYIQRGGREGKIAALGADDIQYLKIQHVLYSQKFAQRNLGNVDTAAQINAVIVEAVQRHAHAVRLYIGIGLQRGNQLSAQSLDFIMAGIVGQPDSEIPQAALAAVTGILPEAIREAARPILALILALEITRASSLGINSIR